jgi:integrase
MAASQAPGSRTNINSTARLDQTFCLLAGFSPWPVTLRAVIYFCVDYVLRGNSPATLCSVLSRLKRHCLEQGWTWLNSTQWFYVRAVRQGLRRLYQEEPTRATACTLAIIQGMLEVVSAANTIEFMTFVMIVVAHNGLLRGGELRDIKVGDLRWDNTERTRCSIRIGKSKTNQFGKPDWVPYEDWHPTSAVAFLRAYVAMLNLDNQSPEAPLFPHDPTSVMGWRCQSRATFSRRFRSLLARAGFEPKNYSGHSFRSGGATDLFNGRCRPHMIKLQGRWLSDAIWIYVRDCPEFRRSEVSAAFARVYGTVF